MPDDALEGLRRLTRRQRTETTESSTKAGRHRRMRGVRRRWPRRSLIAVNVLSAVLILGAGGAYGYVQWRLGEIKRISVGGLHAQGHSDQSKNDGASIPPFTLLAIGSDTRNLGAGDSAQFGNDAQVGGQRSDSIILIRVVPKTRSLALLSIPRDTLVQIPGYGKTRINTAFNSGTPTLLVNVLDQDFGIQVNHVVEFNFDTFEQIANAVGGVEQWFPAPAKDNFSLLNVPAAGCVNLQGAQALAFVRSREYQYYLNGEWHYQLFPESDLARIQRQQSFTRSLARKARSMDVANVVELNNIIASVTKNLTVDKTLGNSEILSLAEDYRSADLSTIPSFTYPAVNSTSVPGALDPQYQAGQSVIQQWLDVGQSTSSTSGTGNATSNTTVVTPTTSVSPSGVHVEVENGSGIGGQAGTAGEELTNIGYDVTVSGDAPNFGLATTQIDYAPDSLAAAKQIQSQIVGASALVKDNALTPTRYNVEVVTGQAFGGVKGATGSTGTTGSGTGTAPSTTTSTVPSPAYDGTATVNPDSSSIYDGAYIPPGLTAGQTPQTCR
ncbi:MAG TPA: LCP family protein [Acidimicrobiales bacterium]|jgi:LCP family protein required for cell wall assembly|nr:LCP family protein [Acidimicrobiales bacterium]